MEGRKDRKTENEMPATGQGRKEGRKIWLEVKSCVWKAASQMLANQVDRYPHSEPRRGSNVMNICVERIVAEPSRKAKYEIHEEGEVDEREVDSHTLGSCAIAYRHH